TGSSSNPFANWKSTPWPSAEDKRGPSMRWSRRARLADRRRIWGKLAPAAAIHAAMRGCMEPSPGSPTNPRRFNRFSTMNDVSAPAKLVGSLSAGFKILRYLASAGSPLGVTRIAKDLGLNASTCFNLLKTLVHERLVTFDEGTKTYSLGLGMVELAKGSLEKASYVRLMRPHLKELAERHNITATLWQRTRNDRVVLVDLAESGSTRRIHRSIGQRLPMYIAALGRCMAAHSGLSTLELRRKVSELRWEEGPSFETYMREVEEVRRNGYAVDHGN